MSVSEEVLEARIDVLEDQVEHLQEQLADSSKTIERLKEQLEIARIVLGQIAMFSSDKADAVQCAKAIKDMSEVEK